ncbi:MAG: RraA family protein [Firmicutes bacterium]|nr:RraA family protein [Bacillota bacterium]
MAVGRRIYLKRELPDPALIEAFKQIPASNTADCMERNCGMHPRIKLMSSPKAQMSCGAAFTVKCRAGDNMGIHAAMRYVEEGDYLVISNEEDGYRSLIGEVMMTYLYRYKKIAGIIIDGSIRDIDELSKWDFPIYATGTNPGGPYKEGPFEINVPISCGGISVYPGDIILADPDGVIVIPRKDAPEILEAAQKFMANDQKKALGAAEGKKDYGWLDKAMEAKKYEIIDDYYRP